MGWSDDTGQRGTQKMHSLGLSSDINFLVVERVGSGVVLPNSSPGPTMQYPYDLEQVAQPL